ncbi:Cytochrome P450 107B1 [Micromonospora sp. MW-13]|uniref:cytochrome P450 family protein n=1 Tax=Micromonospora sp. MW-13 TaxID=2094022 RepID=UPI000EE57A98|nr:cytochrome P450 [Micromonospora sp. MW-13]RGC69185.1 Cytochrome P450 107B1 [Micromonospora sp. MW-13]
MTVAPARFDIPKDFSQQEDPYALLEAIRASGRVQQVRLRGAVPVWLVTGYAEAVAALNDPRLSNSLEYGASVLPGPAEQRRRANVLAWSMLSVDPPDHTRLRGVVARGFTARLVEQLKPQIQELTDGLLDAVAPTGRADLVNDLAFPLPIAVICRLLGVPYQDHRLFRGWSVGLAMPPADPDTLRRADAARAEMTRYFEELVPAKRAEPGDDLLSALTQAHAAERLTDTEVVAMAIMLLLSGHETTVCFIGSAIVAMLRDPGLADAVRRDSALLPPAIEELLRLNGPVTRGVARFTKEEVEFGGVRIPAGEMVVVSLAAANRDPAQFPRPEVVDLARNRNPHLSFGHGMHHCLGQALARQQATIALGTVLRRLPDLALAKPLEEVRRWPGMLRGLDELPVSFTPVVAS